MSRKVAFFGSPNFALPVLEAIMENAQVVLVVAQPNKPAGRGNKMTPPPVALRALELGLPLVQPHRLRTDLEFAQRLKDSRADLAITSAYGKILPAHLLNIPPFGFINTHASLLPLYRGAAPIQRALIEGQTVTGMTLMQTDIGMDTGDILAQESLMIPPDWTSLELFDALSQLAARMIVPALHHLEAFSRTPQEGSQASYAPMLTKDEGGIRWKETGESIYNRYRGTYGWPGSYSFLDEKRIKVLKMRPVNLEVSGAPGEILSLSTQGVVVAVGAGAIEVLEVQPENKGKISAVDWFKNFQIQFGQVFSDSNQNRL